MSVVLRYNHSGFWLPQFANSPETLLSWSNKMQLNLISEGWNIRTVTLRYGNLLSWNQLEIQIEVNALDGSTTTKNRIINAFRNYLSLYIQLNASAPSVYQLGTVNTDLPIIKSPTSSLDQMLVNAYKAASQYNTTQTANMNKSVDQLKADASAAGVDLLTYLQRQNVLATDAMNQAAANFRQNTRDALGSMTFQKFAEQLGQGLGISTPFAIAGLIVLGVLVLRR